MSTRVETEVEAGVRVARLVDPERGTNTLGTQALDDLERVVARLEGEAEGSAGLILTSGKRGTFLTGADLFEMKEMDREALRAFIERGQTLFERIANLSAPTVAAINGTCLGGGLELALACDRRVAADEGAIDIGLPEVKLGILPAWGGTVRLVETIGVRQALPLLLTGKTVPPRKARSLGLLDDVVRPEALGDGARRLLQAPPRGGRRAPRVDRVIRRVGPLRSLVAASVRRRTRAHTHGNYPAPERIVDVVEAGCRSRREGLDAERTAVEELGETEAAKHLTRIFFLRQQAKRTLTQRLRAVPAPVRRTAVVGGGTMGAGIAHAMARAGLAVRLIDVNEGLCAAALRTIQKHLDDDVKAKRLTWLEARAAMQRISPATGFDGLTLADLVVEAVVERVEVKQEVFEKVDRATRSDAVLASNTSSLSVTEIGRSTSRPERVVGLHFFNPVAKMPLVEVVHPADATGETGDRAVSTAGALVGRLGKVPILTGDSPGFLVNRLLIPYLLEALRLVSEGAPVVAVNRTMRQWGMPMGPLELLDQVGIDVAMDIFRPLRERMGTAMAPPQALETAVDLGWLGRKRGCGFYVDETPTLWRRGRRTVNHSLVEMVRAGGDGVEPDEATIRWRLLLPMVNEAAKLLQERVVDSAETIDLATVLGLGLAPFRGGLVRFAEGTGLPDIVRKMDQLAEARGPRFEPHPELRRIADAGRPMEDLVRTAREEGPAASGEGREADAAVGNG